MEINKLGFIKFNGPLTINANMDFIVILGTGGIFNSRKGYELYSLPEVEYEKYLDFGEIHSHNKLSTCQDGTFIGAAEWHMDYYRYGWIYDVL